MSNQLNEGPLKVGGGRGGERSEEARQALLHQLKQDFAHVPPTVEEIAKGLTNQETARQAMAVMEPRPDNAMEVDDWDNDDDVGVLAAIYTNQKVAQILEEALQLFQRKNSEYGNAIESTGVLGAVVAATGDIARLRVMVLRSPDHGRGTAANVRDKLVDILVQAAIGIYMVDAQNWEGK